VRFSLATSHTLMPAQLTQLLERLTLVVSVLAAGYHFLTIWVVPHGATRHYATHFMLVVILAALNAGIQAISGRLRALRLGCLASLVFLTVVSAVYLYVEDARLVLASPWLNSLDLVIAGCVTLVVLGMTLMVWGATITLFCVLSIAYMFFGHLLPDPFWHVQAPKEVVMTDVAGMAAVRGAFWAVPLSADTVFLILTFGGLLQGCRVIEMFVEIGKAVGNIVRGGIAYSAVVASTLIAMVTGEAISNVALAGTVTIPTMKAKQFTAEQAGAIEVVASSGSQITPPIMSVAAFLMAMILGVPYIEIAAAAVLPAIIYFCGLAVGITLLIRSSPNVTFEREPVDVRLILQIAPSFVVSFSLLIFLLYQRYSPGFAAFWAGAALLILTALRPRSARPDWARLFEGLKSGVMIAAQLGVVILAIGIIIQTFITTGAGIILGRLIQEASGGHLWVATVVGSLVAIAIGTALPTPAAYALLTVVLVPTLIDLGARPIAAHFFALYWAAFSTITPPVAVGVLAAVRISGGSFLQTSWAAVKLSVVVFLLPFAFVLHPEILGLPRLGLDSLFLSVLMLLFAFSSAAALYGHLRTKLAVADRWLLAFGAVSLFGYFVIPSYWFILPVTIALAIVFLRQHRYMPVVKLERNK
jgi:TRAP transporter 4TM/12TM fusion protein